DNDVVGDFINNAAGDRQTYTLNITNVAVLDEADLARKRKEFEDAVRKNFLNDSQTVVADGEPKFEHFATQARLDIHVVLLAPVSVKDFTETVRSVKEGPLATELLDVKPVNPDAETAKEFQVTSAQPLTFSADPENPANFNRIEGDINSAIAKSLKDATREGNEISR